MDKSSAPPIVGIAGFNYRVGDLTNMITPDRRYIVDRGRLWRAANPNLPKRIRDDLVKSLMTARRAIYKFRNDLGCVKKARALVQEAKELLGERGKPWWKDGAPDYNRHLIKNTPYCRWYESTRPST